MLLLYVPYKRFKVITIKKLCGYFFAQFEK